MTKLAVLRRQCRRAKRTLMRRWPREYYEERFEDAKGEYDLLDGTPVVWSEPDYYSGESDYKTAVDELRFLQWCESTDWNRIARQVFARGETK